MRFLLPGAFIFISLCSCKPNKSGKNYEKIQNLSWLIGEWQDTSSALHFMESWAKKDDSTFSGNGFGIEKNDTIFRESLKVAQREGKIYYIATINEHLAGKPVAFVLVSDSANKWIFENPQHDFPQRITYSRSSENALHAEVEGLVNGKHQSESFEMQRIKNIR